MNDKCKKCINSSKKWIDEADHLLGGYIKLICLVDGPAEINGKDCNEYKSK